MGPSHGLRSLSVRCARLHVDTTGEPITTCDAFPEGIPSAVLFDEVDHRTPYTGDHGLQWTPATKGGLHPRDPQFYEQNG